MNDEQLNRQLRALVDGAAAPLSQTEVVLRASSPARKSRPDWHLTEHRLIVVAVAAVIIVVFFVPLPSLSLFNRLSHTGLSSNQSPAATIPAGWVPVTLGGARISVPAPWWVLYNSPDCPWGKEPGEVLVNPTPTACPAPTPGDVPKNVIELYSFHGHHYGHLQVINGITVYWSGGNVYEVPSLGISIAIIGPLGKRVLDTLTRLPDRLPFVDLQQLRQDGCQSPSVMRRYRYRRTGTFCSTCALPGHHSEMCTSTRAGASAERKDLPRGGRPSCSCR